MTEKKSTKPADKKAQGEAPESGEAPFGAQVHVDLGFGGLFKGISNLLDLVGNLAEAGENMNRTGEFKVGDNEKMQGVDAQAPDGPGSPSLQRHTHWRPV